MGAGSQGSHDQNVVENGDSYEHGNRNSNEWGCGVARFSEFEAISRRGSLGLLGLDVSRAVEYSGQSSEKLLQLGSDQKCLQVASTRCLPFTPFFKMPSLSYLDHPIMLIPNWYLPTWKRP